MIKIGIAGVGEKDIPDLIKNNVLAGEVEFVRQIYLNVDKAKKLGEVANYNNFGLSIHGPYYINLNSEKKEIIQASVQRILSSCEMGHYMGAKSIVFHAGYYGEISKKESYENIKQKIIEMLDIIKEKKWGVQLCPETMGKINVFGSWEEIRDLVKETKCGFCMDFAHMKARNFGKNCFEEYVKEIKHFEHVHCHYSGIEWNNGGEKKHLAVDMKEAAKLFSLLKEHKVNCTIINESTELYEDAVKMAKIV